MINKNIITKIKKKKKIIIVGRGPTARFSENYKFSAFYIGLNVNKVLSKKMDLNYDKRKLIDNKYRLKVGSVKFGLYELLYYLDQKFKEYNIKKNIYLVGFDFRKTSRDEDLEKKKLPKRNLQQLIDVDSQKIAFNIIKNEFKNIKVKRIGFDIDADLNPRNWHAQNNQIKSKHLDIVAEITTNHLGDTERLVKIIDSCVNAGCNNIKFQKRDVENFYSKKQLNSKYKTPISNNFYEYRKKLELNDEQLSLIKEYQKKYNLGIIFSALDFKSYKQLLNKDFKFFKIPSTISKFTNFINDMSNENLSKIIISTGMTNENYVNFISKKFKKINKLFLLHTISSYPTFFADININIITKYKKMSEKQKNIIPGYSSHDIGDLGCMLAIVAGARMIEKHVKFGVTDWVHFDDTAIDVNTELPNFVDKLYKINTALGSEKKIILNTEHHKYSPL